MFCVLWRRPGSGRPAKGTAWPPAVGIRPAAVGHRPLAVGYRRFSVGSRPLAAVRRPLATGHFGVGYRRPGGGLPFARVHHAALLSAFHPPHPTCRTRSAMRGSNVRMPGNHVCVVVTPPPPQPSTPACSVPLVHTVYCRLRWPVYTGTDIAPRAPGGPS